MPNFITVLFALLGGLADVAVEFLSFLRVYLSICEAIHHTVDISHAEFRVPGYVATWVPGHK